MARRGEMRRKEKRAERRNAPNWHRVKLECAKLRSRHSETRQTGPRQTRTRQRETRQTGMTPLQYSVVGHCNSRLDSCWCFCIFIGHKHRLIVATRSKPENGSNLICATQPSRLSPFQTITDCWLSIISFVGP